MIFIIRALLARIVSGEQVAKVVGEWQKPAHEECALRNVGSLFNGFTEVLKGTSPMAAIIHWKEVEVRLGAGGKAGAIGSPSIND